MLWLDPSCRAVGFPGSPRFLALKFLGKYEVVFRVYYYFAMVIDVSPQLTGVDPLFLGRKKGSGSPLFTSLALLLLRLQREVGQRPSGILTRIQARGGSQVAGFLFLPFNRGDQLLSLLLEGGGLRSVLNRRERVGGGSMAALSTWV
jgi:hypothetical protein